MSVPNAEEQQALLAALAERIVGRLDNVALAADTMIDASGRGTEIVLHLDGPDWLGIVWLRTDHAVFVAKPEEGA